MRVGTTTVNGNPCLALSTDDTWIDLSRACCDYESAKGQEPCCACRNLRAFIAAGRLDPAILAVVASFVRDSAKADDYTLKDPQFLLPYRPMKVVAIGRNYRAHVAEFDNQMPTEPIFFVKSPTACIGPGEGVAVPAWCGRVDHEGELGVVIGRRAKNVLETEAQDYVAGYTLVNDITAREIQKADMAKSNPWFRSKNLDTFCPLGPYVVTRDAVPWPVEVDLSLTVNGELRQESNTEKFIFPIPALIAAITRFMTLEPGDIIATGTPEGVSSVHPGDEMTVRVPEIGVLSNPVVSA